MHVLPAKFDYSVRKGLINPIDDIKFFKQIFFINVHPIYDPRATQPRGSLNEIVVRT